MKYTTILCFAALFASTKSYAALPFVTDDAFIQSPKQLALETFFETWRIPSKNEPQTNLYGQYVSLSYGLSKHFELSVGGMGGYESHSHTISLMNPLVQLKVKMLDGNTSPNMAIDFGYINNSGIGDYYDPATNFYAITAITSHFHRLAIHINLGVKSSYDIPTGSITRPHIGIAFDFAPFPNEKFRAIFESYNGAPNSPRDSSGYFQSYQIGGKYVQSHSVSYHILYGSQPTFTGYENNNSTYIKTDWIQVGIRKCFGS